jgi:hypothetical protein
LNLDSGISAGPHQEGITFQILLAQRHRRGRFPGDNPSSKFETHMAAGAGLCDPKAVRELVDEGPSHIAAS